MSLVIDSSSINRAKRMLIGVPKGADKAIANAINKSARTAVTGVIKGIRKKYVIKSSKARKYGTFIKRAKPGNLSAIINIKGKVVPLGYFDIKPNTPKRVVPFARVKKGGGGNIDEGFVQTMPSNGYTGVFKRYKYKTFKASWAKPRPKKRGKGMTKGIKAIETYYGPSVSYMAKNPEIHANITLNVQKTFNENVEKQISNILNKQS